MRKIILLLLIIFLVVVPLLPDETIEKEFKAAEGETLAVNLKSGGAIKISGWDRKLVSIKVVYKDTEAKDWDFEFRETAAGIKIESRRRAQKAKSPVLEVLVPVKYDLELKTMGGAVTIDNIAGDISGRTMGGDLDLGKLKGKINFKTMGGEIVLQDSDIDGRLKTYGGRVLFENVTGDVKGTSLGGNVVYKNVKSRGGESTGKAVHLSTMGGSLNVNDAPEGAKLHTMGGNIHIRSAKKFVSAKTMGGNIEIGAVDGWVKATTMGGNIKVTMTGDLDRGKRDVTLSSMGGDIVLIVPPGLSMDVDIELIFTKKNSKKYKISSDFDLQEKVSDHWDFGSGSPRKSIYGKAVIKGGKHKIEIKTVNGNIYLKKSN
ncbi:MAG: hypothetical protein KAW12_13155 [Candidatus Aminicenantes bacterium]|nr:hypothetical protein [Candidatus Aminicenantes bacterium]